MKYSTLYRLKIEHEYYINKVCRSIDVRPTPSTLDLLRRRGLVFRQTEENEWCLLGDCDKASLFIEENEFLFDMYLLDPLFVYYTQWEDLKLNFLYDLTLPILKNGNFIDNVRLNDNKRKVGSGFCLASLRFNRSYLGEMPDNIFDNILKFQAKEVLWEYVFINRSNYDLLLGMPMGLKLVEQNGIIDFSFVDGNLYIYRFKSSKPIKISECYDCQISLINEDTKKELLNDIPFPTPGKFMNLNIESANKGETDIDTIQQVCYL